MKRIVSLFALTLMFGAGCSTVERPPAEKSPKSAAAPAPAPAAPVLLASNDKAPEPAEKAADKPAEKAADKPAAKPKPPKPKAR